MASSGRNRLAYTKEAVFGVTPVSAGFKSIPFNTGDMFTNSRDALTSSQVQSSRSVRSTRLGVNKPDKTVTSELQWGTFDELLSGGLGSRWIGGFTVSPSVTVSTGGVLTRSTGSFIDDGFLTGSFVLYDDDGILIPCYVHAVADLTLTLYEADDTALTTVAVAVAEGKQLICGCAGGRIDAGANSVTFSATSGTITLGASGKWDDYSVKIGDNLYIYGTSLNDGWVKITGIVDSVLTTSTALTNESIITGNIDIMVDAGYCANGETLDSFTFEETQADIDEPYRVIRGCKIGSLGISVQSNAMVQLTLAVNGASITNWSSSSIAGSTTDYVNREAFDSFTGSILIDNTVQCITSCDFTLNNATGRNFCLFARDASNMTDGIPTMTGNVSAFFNDAMSYSSLYYNETESDYILRMVDKNGNAYVLTVNNAKYTGDTISIGDIDVIETLPYSVQPNSTGDEVSLRRQPTAR